MGEIFREGLLGDCRLLRIVLSEIMVLVKVEGLLNGGSISIASAGERLALQLMGRYGVQSLICFYL